MKSKPTMLSRWIGQSKWRLFLVILVFSLLMAIPDSIIMGWNDTPKSKQFAMSVSAGMGAIIGLFASYMLLQQRNRRATDAIRAKQ